MRLERVAVVNRVFVGTLFIVLPLTHSFAGPAPERVVRDPIRGTAEVVTGRFASAAGATAQAAAIRFFAERPELYGLDDPARELRLRAEITDELGLNHLRYDQQFAGLRVWGCQTIVHFDTHRDIYLVAGQTVPTPDVPTTPALDAKQAQAIAIADVQDVLAAADLESSPELLIYPDDGQSHLAWLITVTVKGSGAYRWRVFVDAQTGVVRFRYNDVPHDGPATGWGIDVLGVSRPLQTYQIDGTYKLIDASQPMYAPPVDSLTGVIVTYDGWRDGGPITSDPNGDNAFDDHPDLRPAVSAHYFAQLSYEYFLNTFGRNSYDDSGSTLIVSAHDSTVLNNAFWSSDGSINFGDGDGINFIAFSGDLDIVAHEFTHGVTEYTADLIYAFQSGALNEHYSDFFGAMVDRDDWLMGENITLKAPGFIRSMADPHLAGHPAHMSEYEDLPGSVDLGGVHINSGIGNHAGYLAATALGRDLAERIWYRTLTVYLTPSSSYPFWALMTLRATEDLYGRASAELAAMTAVMDSVGLGGVYADPDRVTPFRVKSGTQRDTAFMIFNLGAADIRVDSVVTSRPELHLLGPAPATLALLDTVAYAINYDATALLSHCDLGRSFDTVTLYTSSPLAPLIQVPLTTEITYVDCAPDTSYLASRYAELKLPNTPGIEGLLADGIDALFDGSLVIGMVDGTDTIAYWDLYEPGNFVVVDTFVAGAESPWYETRTLRFVTPDDRLDGSVTYRYDEVGFENGDAFRVSYTLHNTCDTALTFFVGLYADFNLPPFVLDFADVDTARHLILIRDYQDTHAAGLILLTGEPRNLRAINNPQIAWDGLTAPEVYGELAATTNPSGPTMDDWSALLTFGEVTLALGDSVRFEAALLYGAHGSLDVIGAADALALGDCPVALSGDVNADGTLNSADVVYLVNYIFKQGPQPLPVEPAGDPNCSGHITATDVLKLVNYVFKAGPAPCDICSLL